MSPELMRAMTIWAWTPSGYMLRSEAGMNQAEIERAIFGGQNEIRHGV